MREAVVEAKLAVGETRDAVTRTERDLAQERQRLADAERRGRAAQVPARSRRPRGRRRSPAPGAQEENEEGLVMSLIRDVLAWFRDSFESGGGPRNADGRRGGSMDIKRDRMVFLGYGKYWRSDGIVGLMPIEEERGPKRRTNVLVQGRPDPIVAS